MELTKEQIDQVVAQIGLKNVDERIATFLKNQEDREKKTADVIATTRAALEKRLEAAETDLKAKDKTIHDLEVQHNSTRFGSDGPDQLKNALPEDLRPWIERVRYIAGGDPFGYAEDGSALRFSSSIARACAKDPVKMTAFGGWLQARIKAFLAKNQGTSEDVAKWNKRADDIAKALGGNNVEQKVALQEDTDAEGGYLVPVILENMIGWLAKDYSVARSAGCSIVQMRSKTHQLPKLASDFTIAWTSEEGSITDGVPATPIGQGVLTAKKQTTLVTVSIELIQDNIVNLLGFIFTHLLTVVGRAEDLQVFEGDGTVFTGLFSASGLASVNAGGQTAGNGVAPTFSDLVSLIFGGEHQATIDGGVIFAHPWFGRDLIKATTGTAGSIYLPFVANSLPKPSNLMGVPYFPTSVISRTRSGATNESVAYHGNPAYIVIGDRMGTTFDANPWSETEWKKGQISLRLMRRVGVLIWVPGYFTKLVNFELS